MYSASMVSYFIFWSIISLIVAILSGISLVYLFYLLQGIKQSLSKIELLLSAKGTEKKGHK